MTDGVPKSPFFRPTEKQVFTQTPGGTQHLRKKRKGEAEHKSSITGCTANVINAIVGAGIVGIPYAIQQTGFVAGIVLIFFCAIMCEKSLRLLVETAKHTHVPSYETVAEAAFGRFGFLFVAVNMFIMAYGAMLSYLMIVKDTFSAVVGIKPDNDPMKRAILFLVSITIMVPLSSQRDMADLAKTSRVNVCFDIIMVILVLYCAPLKESWSTFEWRDDIIRYDTIFVGLGVLSFAFVCQVSLPVLLKIENLAQTTLFLTISFYSVRSRYQ
jgi:sodium-coupled neutral amino acid transporter 11